MFENTLIGCWWKFRPIESWCGWVFFVKSALYKIFSTELQLKSSFPADIMSLFYVKSQIEHNHQNCNPSNYIVFYRKIVWSGTMSFEFEKTLIVRYYLTEDKHLKTTWICVFKTLKSISRNPYRTIILKIHLF